MLYDRVIRPAEVGVTHAIEDEQNNGKDSVADKGSQDKVIPEWLLLSGMGGLSKCEKWNFESKLLLTKYLSSKGA